MSLGVNEREELLLVLSQRLDLDLDLARLLGSEELMDHPEQMVGLDQSLDRLFHLLWNASG